MKNLLVFPHRQYRFEIGEDFVNDLHVGTSNVFNNKNSKSINKNTIIKFHHAKNPYIDNELRGYIQHRVLKEKDSSSTIHNRVAVINNQIIPFLSKYYPDIDSFTDLNAESSEKYILFCQEQNLPLTNTFYSYNTDNTVKRKQSRSKYIYVFESIRSFINDIDKPETDPFDRDIWKASNLPFVKTEAMLHTRVNLNFACFNHEWLKLKIKYYVLDCIQKGESFASIKNKFKSFKKLNKFMTIQCFANLSAFSHVDTLNYKIFLNKQGISSDYLYRHLSNLRSFCEWGFWAYPNDFPASEVVKKTDMPKTVSKEPKIYSATELERLNRLLPKLPKIAARATVLMEYCGLRFSDLGTTPILIDGHSCLTETPEHQYIFQYYMRKEDRYNRQPVPKEIAKVIMEQIQDSQKRYGKNCKFIFAESEKYGYKWENYIRTTAKITTKFKPLTDNGNPLRFMPHTFRRTYASMLANNGIDADTIRALLGQKSLGVQFKHYVTIHSDTMSQYLKPILDQDDALIRNIGHVDTAMLVPPDNFNDFIPLPNGACTCGGDCPHQNTCYTCPFYQPMKKYLPIYQMQLAHTEDAIKAAADGKHTAYYEKMIVLRDSLQKIIDKVEAM